MKAPHRLALWILISSLLVGCSLPPVSAARPTSTEPQGEGELPAGTVTRVPVATRTALPPSGNPSLAPAASVTQPFAAQALPIVSPTPTLSPDNWQAMPVVPESISTRTREIYLHGLALGNNPHAFSKVGDCGSTPAWFLGDFDRGPDYYSLGSNQELAAPIDYFQGSFARTSLAAKSGMNASSAFVPLWANRDLCQDGETPIACEYRVHRPSFVLIMLGTNDVWHPDRFEPQMRRIVEFYIENGVVPILSTKADNLEGDGSLNAVIARLAQEYEIPLWNYWRAAQSLPNGGLQEDGAHLTFARNYFDDPQMMKAGWPWRNLTALQVLQVVWQGVTKGES